MERSIRIGKDFNVRWSIRKVVDGERQPYELAGKELVLQYRTPYGLKEATEWKVVGNTVVWTFRGKEQKALGSHELILTENGGKDGMVTVDTCRAFKLVAHSCEETEGSGSDIVTDVVMLESEVAFAPVVTHDDTAIWEALASQEQLIEDLQNMKIDREADDYYPKLSVGLADNLAGVDVVDSEINFRRSGGGAITDGVARIESIKGNSVVWNQLVNGENSLTLRNSHKYMTIIGSVAAIKTNIATLDVAEEDRVYDLTKMFGSGNEPTTIEEFYARIPMGVDLNAYNEGEVIHMDVQSIESVGVNAWDEEWEVGEISGTTGVDLSGTGTTIRTGFIRVIPNLQYYISIQGKNRLFLRARLYDADKNFIGITSASGADIYTNEAFTVPTNAHYIRFAPQISVVAQSDLFCINLSDTSINGKYFPYIKRAEDLAVIRKYFPQGMKSAGSAHDEIRYNKASGKWEKVVRIGEVDLGTLNWDYVGASDSTYSMISDSLKALVKPPQNNADKANVLCIKFVTDTADGEYSRKNKESIGLSYTGRITIYAEGYTSTSSPASFKAAMQGVILYYELAEPIVTELDEADQFRDLDYQVWNVGTEKAIAEGKSAPLAADITYGFNAIGKIKELESLVAQLRAKVGI